MVRIQLPKGEWNYDPEKPLGKPGGFGSVFDGFDERFGTLAIKKLHITAEEAGHRELRIANELMKKELTHVIPILDAGIDANTGGYFFIMPRADYSLQQEIEKQGKLSDAESIKILRQIVTGLLEVPDIVHRDIKPANILYHEGKWKIADFGIARFIEESTSINTMKEFLSPQYAAPEQWNQERATSKTDIYALGCIAYALIAGAPPFQGPDFKEQHINSEPPILECNAQLRSWILLMLRKIPEARPDLARANNRLDEIIQSVEQPSESFEYDLLAKAGAKAAEEAIKSEVVQNSAQQLKKKRTEIAKIATKSLSEIIDTLFEVIKKYAPTAKNYKQPNPYVWLGSAMLQIELPPFKGEPLDPVFFEDSSWDVIYIGKINVTQQTPHYIWGANLFYADADRKDQYRWYEILFMAHPLIGKQPRFQPFSIDIHNYKDAGIALGGKAMGVIQLAAKPTPIDDENLQAFCNRWSELLAKAYSGELTHPCFLPLA